MKKIITTLAACSLFLCSLITSAIAADYSDAIKVHEQLISVMEKYVAQLNAAQSGADVVAASDNYSGMIQELAPQLKAIAEKYPEMEGEDTPVPAELQPLATRAEEVGGKLAAAMMKVMPYMSDPAVREAQERMAEAMSKLDGEQ